MFLSEKPKETISLAKALVKVILLCLFLTKFPAVAYVSDIIGWLQLKYK